MTASGDPILSFDIGGTNLRGAIVRDGAVLADARVLSGGMSPQAVAAAAAALARTLESNTGQSPRRVGVGVAAMLPEPGDVVENAPNLGWRDAPLARLLREALGGRAVRLFNDVDAVAYGETAYGAARGARHAVCVFVGTGVGAGIIVDGRLLRGHRGVAAEVGHIKVVADDGRACGCGAYGCLEAYVGGAALLARIQEAVQEGSAPSGASHVGHVDEAARRGEPWATAMWTGVEALLALALANLVTVLNPEVLVLGGGVLARAPLLAERVRARTLRLTNAVATKGLRIVDAELGDDAGLIGAASLARDLESATPT